MNSQSGKLLYVQLGTTNLDIVTVTVDNFTADTISLRYSGLPGNLPHKYGNFVAIWNQTIIPWGQDPIQKQDISGNAQTGTIVMTDLVVTASSYTIGYACGPDYTDIAASTILSAGGLRGAPTSISIGLNAVGSNSVSINYRTLVGYRPKTYKNWIGIWKGYYSPFNSTNPLGFTEISSDSSEGNVAINNIVVGINSVYTLVYFTGKEETTAAAILTFNTGDYQKAFI
ncbi:hypothetical protein [Sinomicrobium sp. M5D2P9]